MPNGWLNALKNLTVTNALVALMIAFALTPLYVIYRALNDDELLGRMLSEYAEVDSAGTNCLVRKLKQRGGPTFWGVSTAFAVQGNDRWLVSAQLISQPRPEDIQAYCTTLRLLVDVMRNASIDDLVVRKETGK
jgi:hypothetical protein